MSLHAAGQPPGVPEVHTVPPGLSFVDALAHGLLARFPDPAELASALVLLPTQRSCRQLSEAFLRATAGRPLLLPRIVPLGAGGDDSESDAPDVFAAAADLPPPFGKMQRQLRLTQLILARQDEGRRLTPGQAAALAKELADLLDDIQRQRLDIGALERLVPADYAEHWQHTIDFLRIVTEYWPAIVQAEGALDPCERVNRILEAQAEAWRREPPSYPVVAAGEPGTLPATAELLAVVARLPRGCVVLHGLDRDCDDDAWDRIDDTHPQFLLARLLRIMEVDRRAVTDWPSGPLAEANPMRFRLLSEAMRPAEATDRWRDLPGTGFEHVAAEGLRGLKRFEAAGPREEAQAIALLLRQVLDTPGRTAALVTPDRNLARRVAAAIQRWGIQIDDSAGQPLTNTTVGTFLRLVAEVATERAAPLALLACLKHPLAACGRSPGQLRAAIRALEIAVLRGPRPASGFSGLRAAVLATADGRFDGTARETMLALVDDLTACFAPLMEAMAAEQVPLLQLVRIHTQVCEAVARTAQESGRERLWRREDGECAAVFFERLQNAAAAFPDIDGAHYPPLLLSLMSTENVRPRFGRHPRLSILGPLEARLENADVMVLGGLTEKCWPPEAEADPWLSRPMRAALGLPSPERVIGQYAQDFMGSACAPTVYLTRALRSGGAPTVPSRWLLRLETVLDAVDVGWAKSRAWADWALAIDRPAAVRPVAPPAPRPPVAVRPRRLRATEIETWMRDPYTLYARHVLRLEPLEPLDADPGAAERGQFVHDALDRFVREYPDRLPADAVAKLLDYGREAFGDLLARPEVWAFWWPRFERIARWFVDFETEWRKVARPVGTEVPGEVELPGPAGPFKIRVRADRIDRFDDGRLAIVDYKTGSVPAQGDVKDGLSPQLSLEGLIAQAGGFQGIAAAPVGYLGYIKLSGGAKPGEEKAIDADIAELIAQATDGVTRLIAAFDDETMPYEAAVRLKSQAYASDYWHLARVKEWAASSGGDET